KRLRSASRMPGTEPCATTTTGSGCAASPIAPAGRLIAAANARTQRAARRCGHESWLKRLSSQARYMIEPGRPKEAISSRSAPNGSSVMKQLAIWGTAAWCVVALAATGFAQDAAPGPSASGNPAPSAPEDWSFHAQTTFIEQGNLRFHSPYRGRNSLDPAPRGRESWTGTLFLGARLPWDSGGALYFDPEFNQGFGLSRTEGVAGFVNGEAQKGGFDNPKLNVARLFLRQNFGLGGDKQQIAADKNQLTDSEDANRVTVTIGKYSPTDLFDTNDYANDPREDFLNGAIWAAGAWDYPADSKGYTDGATVEWVHPQWTLRGGWFLEPKIANSRDLEPRFWRSFGSVLELENHFS